MAMPANCTYLRPLDILFSQDTIASTFHDGVKIGHTLDLLVNMETFVTDIPTIAVVKYDDKYFTRNSRRLWVFRQLALMGKCEYIPTLLAHDLPSAQFTTDVEGHEIIVRGDPGSSKLESFTEKQRHETMATVRSMRDGPITPSFRFNFCPRFKAFQKQAIRGKKRTNLFPKLRGKRNRPADQPVDTEFDFEQYATLTVPRIAFTKETSMVFGQKSHELGQPEKASNVDASILSYQIAEKHETSAKPVNSGASTTLHQKKKEQRELKQRVSARPDETGPEHQLLKSMGYNFFSGSPVKGWHQRFGE